MPTMQIDITSDTVCPWCYIGFAKLRKALEDPEIAKASEFKIRFHPFFLNENKIQAQDKKEFYAERYWSQEAGEAARTRLQKAGESVGIQFNWGGKVSSTLDSHRLIEKAYEINPEAHLAMVEIMFKGYNERAKDMGSIQDLSDLAAETKVMSKDEAISFLKSDELKDKVSRRAQFSRDYGIDSVPYISFDEERDHVSGAYEVEQFKQTLRRLLRL